MRRFCRVIVALFAIVYLMALLLLAIGTFGWFGQPRDPLSGVFLILLGFPWPVVADRILGLSGWHVGALGPMVNLLLLSLICRVR